MGKILCTELIRNLRHSRKSDIVFIIGGGPSKLKYLPDDSLLDHKEVIATNNAYKLFPNAIVAHFADVSWYDQHKEKLAEFKGPITTSARFQNHYLETQPVTIFKKETSKYVGLCSSIDSLAGNNAGHQAINLAYHIGFTKIVLIGFDMDINNKETHWHDEHTKPTNKATYQHTMIPGMKNIAQELFGKPVKIYNVNKESAIDCFEFADLNKFL